MVDRLRGLGLPGVTARTFHAHALSQLRHFWPLHHDGAPLPALLDSKLPLLVPLVRSLPGHYRFTPAKDLADEIEWAKSRRLTPVTYERGVTGTPLVAEREPPIPLDLFVRAFAGYERAKTRAGRIDFDDLMTETVDLLEGDADAAELVRARKRWFSVDEYQDTNPLQQRLLELWLGDRRDLCVVGDEDQTIYTFTGATSTYLTGFEARFPGRAGRHARRELPVVAAGASPWRTASSPRPAATSGSSPRGRTARNRRSSATGRRRRSSARSSSWIGARIGEGTAPAEIAVLVRMNAQLAPIEAELTRADIPYQVRGMRFFDRAEVRGAIDLVRRGEFETQGVALTAAVRQVLDPSGWATTTSRATAGPATRHANGRPRSIRCSTSSNGSSARTRGPMRRRISTSSTDDARRSARARPTASTCSRSTEPRASNGMRSTCRRSRRDRCRSASRSTTTRRSPRSFGSCMSGSPVRDAISRCRGRPNARRVAARPGDSRAGSSPICGRDRPGGGRGGVRELPGAPVAVAVSSPGRRRRSADGRVACLAHVPCPGGRDAPVRHRPRRDPGGHRRGAPAEQRRSLRGSRASARPRSMPTATRSSRSWPPTSRPAVGPTGLPRRLAGERPWGPAPRRRPVTEHEVTTTTSTRTTTITRTSITNTTTTSTCRSSTPTRSRASASTRTSSSRPTPAARSPRPSARPSPACRTTRSTRRSGSRIARLEPYAGDEPSNFQIPTSDGQLRPAASGRASCASSSTTRRYQLTAYTFDRRRRRVALRPVPGCDERHRDVRRRPLPRPRARGGRHVRPRLQPRLPPVVRLRRAVLLSADAGREPPVAPDRGRRAPPGRGRGLVPGGAGRAGCGRYLTVNSRWPALRSKPPICR